MAGRNWSIIEKIPKLEDIAPVYAVIVMMLYSSTFGCKLYLMVWHRYYKLYQRRFLRIFICFHHMLPIEHADEKRTP